MHSPDIINLAYLAAKPEPCTWSEKAHAIVMCGRMLIDNKRELKHGEWGPWVKQHCAFTHDPANKMMRAAKSIVTMDMSDLDNEGFAHNFVNDCWNPQKKDAEPIASDAPVLVSTNPNPEPNPDMALLEENVELGDAIREDYELRKDTIRVVRCCKEILECDPNVLEDHEVATIRKTIDKLYTLTGDKVCHLRSVK